MRIALGLEYDGSGFCGWQRQTTGRTVQGCLEDALSVVADHTVDVVCAGRTDTGVHATGQVIHFDSSAPRDAEAWVRGVNSNLPGDVSVQWAVAVGPDFHARFSARRRSYRYIILNKSVASALLRDRVSRVYQALDVHAMTAAAGHLLGEHDFTSLRAAACQAKHPVRTIYRLDVRRYGDFIYLDVTANAFLHHMVRCIAGVLIAVGTGEQNPDWVGSLLAMRDRAAAGITAPAAGLYLVRVEYEPQFQLPDTAWLPAYDQPGAGRTGNPPDIQA